jgi:hypothetical protein
MAKRKRCTQRQLIKKLKEHGWEQSAAGSIR